MEGVIVPAVEQGVGCLLALIARPYNDLKSLKKNIETLREKMERLSAQERDVNEKLSTGKVTLGKQPKNEVQLWLKNVEKINNAEKNIQNKLAENKKCLKGCLPNYLMRVRLSKLAVEKIQEIDDLQKEYKEWNNMFADPKPAIGLKRSTTTLTGKTIAEKTLERIWTSIMDADIGIIGVYGMGGAGKTTIMKKINDRLVEEGNIFNKIVWVTVSKGFNLEKLQKSIAKELNLDISEIENETTRAAMLLENLERKKFALILDDVWEEFSIGMVGIPTPSKKTGCKILLTTRSLDVCHQMNCIEAIKVESLSEGEAWELFKKNVGSNVKFTPQVEKIAMLVARECACLPLAIITVGQAIKQKDDIKVWRNALRELKSLKSKSMNDKVISQLKFSYERLSDDRVRECFLYCSLYPEDYDIPCEKLIDYWIAEGLIDDFMDREAEMDKGHVVLEELKNSCMLENIDGGKFVKMHDVIRDMAIIITSESNRFIMKASVGLGGSLEVKEWTKDVERISLMNSRITEVIVDGPRSLKLSTLLLQDNPLPKLTPNSFFGQMHSLRVLDLSNTNIADFPESLSDLKNLRALLLEKCRALRKVPSLSKLTELRVLNLAGTGIEALPQGMEGAVNLRHINLNDTWSLKVFRAGVLSNLPLLEDLLMRRCAWKWTVNTLIEVEGAGIEDIISLTRLATLKIDFQGLPGWTSYFNCGKWQSLKSFHFVITAKGQSYKPPPHNFIVEFVLCNLLCKGSYRVLPEKTQFLRMFQCKIQSLELSNLKELKDLWIENCDGMENCIVMDKENTLSTLENLWLLNLPSLRTVCKEAGPSGILASLKILAVSSCHKMKYALPLGLFQHLPNLEEIIVKNCEQIEEIAIGEEREDENEEDEEEEITSIAHTAITLSNLKNLELIRLPKLKRICKRELACVLLKSITVHHCPMLKNLPFSVDNIPPSLQYIRGGKKWWDALEWDADTKKHLQPFFKAC